MPKLDFLVIGAARSGTTSLHHYLRDYPGLALPANKEAPFFVTRDEYVRGWDVFARRLFGRKRSGERMLLGKVTPQYMAGSLYWVQGETPRGDPRQLIGTDDPTVAARIVPRRIADHNPQIKLVALLRDPVERAISHYRHAVRQGWEQRDPADAFGHALRPEALRRARLLPSESLSAFVTFGEYARILDGYRAVFGSEQICVVPFDDLRDDPDAAIQRVLRFIGADGGWIATNSGWRHNASDSVAKLAWLDTRRIERLTSESAICQRLWTRMPPAARRLADEVFMRAAQLEERRNRVSGTDPPGEEYDEVKAVLEAHYAPWNERLQIANGQVRGVTGHE